MPHVCINSRSRVRQFMEQLRYALSATPAPLSDAEQHALSWTGATDRFREAVLESAALTVPATVSDRLIAGFFNLIASGGYRGDLFRKISMAGPVTRQRWLHREKRYRNANVTDIVEKSIAVTPVPSEADIQAIAERNVRRRAC